MVQEAKQSGKRFHDYRSYHRTQMQKELVIQKLKEEGYRITKQRMILLDIILKEECSCCKEIYYRAVKIDHRIGTATVYRMINTLEEIGAISRKNMLKIACDENCEKQCEKDNICTIILEDNTILQLSGKKWSTVVRTGLKACGYINNNNLKSVTIQQYNCELSKG